MKNESQNNKYNYEFFPFLEFLSNATGWKFYKNSCTFYSKNGITGFTNEPIYIVFDSYLDIKIGGFFKNNYKNNNRAFICELSPIKWTHKALK